MDMDKKINGDEWEVSLNGHFSYDDRNNFKEIAFCFSNKNVKKLIIDCGNLDYVDSNGLGMLLVLHEDAKKNESKIILKNLQGNVKTIFAVSNLKDMFIIE